MNDLLQLKDYSHHKLDEQFEELQKLLDEHEDIAKFFKVLTYKFYSPIEQYSKKSRIDLDYVASSVLNRFVWQIWPSVDTDSALSNPYHFNGGWVPSLLSFMINVFLDDSGFAIKKKDCTDEWEFTQTTDEQFLQNPNILVAAAYDVARYWIECDEAFGSCKRSVMKNGMQSSGEVEKLLKRKGY